MAAVPPRALALLSWCALASCSVVYKMCTQKTGNHTEEMYKRYQESFQEYLVSNVLPAVQKLEGEPMVRPAAPLLSMLSDP